ncbi:hypothetical protein [Okeania sp.]|uniref:hypothetical protein n=1 Tax=Okeania sp. TaxID=3100323 RepID=UPI002B4B6DA8|nr:hypothetical protein [Okeania sp.]
MSVHLHLGSRGATFLLGLRFVNLLLHCLVLKWSIRWEVWEVWEGVGRKRHLETKIYFTVLAETIH